MKLESPLPYITKLALSSSSTQHNYVNRCVFLSFNQFRFTCRLLASASLVDPIYIRINQDLINGKLRSLNMVDYFMIKVIEQSVGCHQAQETMRYLSERGNDSIENYYGFIREMDRRKLRVRDHGGEKEVIRKIGNDTVRVHQLA